MSENESINKSPEFSHQTDTASCLGTSIQWLLCNFSGSPPVRWGLLDFMSVTSPPPLFSSPPPSPRSPCRPSLATTWDQCSAPDLNRNPVRSVFRAGPQPRSCEISVPRRTSTAILWDQCSAPDLNRDPVRSVLRAGPQVMCQKMCQRECQKMCQRECQKICQKECQKICLKEVQKECQRKDVRKNVRRNVRKKWGELEVVEDIRCMM